MTCARAAVAVIQLTKTGDHERAHAGLRALLPDLTAVFGTDHAETLHVRTLLENLDRLGHGDATGKRFPDVNEP